MRVIWRTQAVADLRALRDDIARSHPRVADGTAQCIRQSVTQLVTLPHQGRRGRSHNTRERVVPGTPYLVVYRASGVMQGPRYTSFDRLTSAQKFADLTGTARH